MRLKVLSLLALSLVLAVLIVWRSPFRYEAQDRQEIAAGRSVHHAAGTDELGRDRSVRVALAFCVGLAGAVAASAIASCLSLFVGLFTAFVPAALSKAVLYGVDLFLTLPWLFLLMMVRAALPLNIAPSQSAAITFLLLGVLGWPVFARVTYVRAKAMQGEAWMLQARASGVSSVRIALRYVTPHIKPLLVSQFLIYIPACIAAEANLGTLGLGVPEPLPSWGSLIQSMGSSAALAGSHWIYLPVFVLIGSLVMLEMLWTEERS